MSRYPNVRPQPAKSAPPPEPQDSRVDKAVRESAIEIYHKSSGDVIDAAVERCKRLLAVHDKEVEALLNDPQPGYRWTVSPTMALQWQKELDRQLAKQEKLKADCMLLARTLVEDYVRAGQNGRRLSPDELSSTEAPPTQSQHAERETAEASTSG